MPEQDRVRPTIGVVLHDIDDTVGYQIYLGACERGRELGINIFTFIQSAMQRTQAEPENVNLCFNLAFPKLDGLICGIASRTSRMTGQELEAFFKSFGIPLVNIIDQWEGVPSIVLDNYYSMRELVDHLIVEHGFKRIFFIRGPRDHSYANERYQGFCDIMTEHGLFIEELVSQSTDWKPNRQASFQELIGQLRPGEDFEAIVASNDDWAIEAINRLKDWGIEVPGEVAVVGFNNTARGQSATPSLTSSGPSFFDQGKKTVDIIYQLIQGQKVPEQIKLSCKLYVRQSCGCFDLTNIIDVPQELAGQLLSDWDETMLVNYICQILRDNKMESSVKYVNVLIKSLNDCLKGGSPLQFFKTLNNVITRSVDIDKALTVWNKLEITLRNWSNQNIPADNQEQREHFWNQVRNLLRNIFAQNKEKAANRQKELSWKYHVHISHLIRIFNIEELTQFLRNSIADLGFYSFYFIMYEDRQPYENPNPRPVVSRMVLAYNGDQPEIIDMEGKLFPTTDFLPDNLINKIQPFNLIVTPIVFCSHQFGYFVCDYREASPLAYKSFWPQLSSCLRGIYLLKQRIKAEESLQQQKEELARSNGELQQFANIVSHDLQEPLRKILAFGERLLNLKDEISPQGRDYLERIHNATTRMQILINDLLNYSRVTTKAQPFSTVKLGEIVREVLVDLEVKVTDKQAVIELADLPEIKADALQMRQLFQNFIGNALKFTKPGVAPKIQVYSLSLDKDWVQLVIEDNGIGIEKNYYERIFQVFERLHSRNEYEGTGIGLAICKKIVDRHGGTIRVESTLGIGTKFIICLPVNPTTANQ